MPYFGKNEEETAEDKKRILPNFNASKFKPNLDTTKLKGSLKCVSWVIRKIKKRGAAFPIFMILVNLIYLVLGGLIFMNLEKSSQVKVDTSKDLVDIFTVLKNSHVANYTFLHDVSTLDLVNNLTSTDLNKFEQLLTKINSKRTIAGKPKWDMLNSIYFCMTVTTTIGYGHLAPVTLAGRIICVIYALLGIPLTLALLAVVGKFVGDYVNDACALVLKWFRHLYPQYEYESKNQELEDGQIDAPLWLGLLILFAFTTFTAGLCCWMEGWDFGTSFYYQFVTYLTIGFGDVVPQTENYTFIYILLTLLGLSVLSITLSLIASNLHHQVQKASFIERLKEQELSSTASLGSTIGSEDDEYSGRQGRRKSELKSDEDTGKLSGNGGKTYGTNGNKTGSP